MRVAAAESGLPRDAVVNVSQLVTLDRRWIGDCAGCLKTQRMGEIAQGLRLATGMGG